MSGQDKRKSYAISFTSFLLRELNDTSQINKAILYGSVARSTSTQESDIDIFLDVKKKTKSLEKEIEGVLKRFYKSKEAIIYKLFGVENEIKLKIGKLDEWMELKRSIMSDGFVMWSRYESSRPAATQHKIIFYWERIEKNRGAFLNKIYGYRTEGKSYSGFLERVNGTKLGKSCIMIPIKHKEEMITLLKKYLVEAKAIEVFV
jgi:predicted nucleotidyltransferase